MTDRFVMDDFTVSLPEDKMIERLCLTEEEDIQLMLEKRAKALELARPKALYGLCDVGNIGEDSAVIDGTPFESEILAGNLREAGAHKVFAYVVTCGTEVDEWSHLEQDYFVALWLDMLKEMILGEARIQFIDRLRERYGFQKLASMSPGSGNLDTWPIAQQKPLFGLLGDVEGDIGVQLTDGFLMLPTKSVSGILYPSDAEFITCSLCRRENCQSRRAPYREPVGTR